MPTSNKKMSLRKNYSAPACKSQSLSEVCRLLGEKFARETKVEAENSPGIGLVGPALLVAEFSGDFALLIETIENCGLNGHLVFHSGGACAIQVLFNESHSAGCELLERSVPGAAQEQSARLARLAEADQPLNPDAPSVRTGVIVTNDSHLLQNFGRADCWRIGGPVDEDLLLRAIHSIYDLWAFSVGASQSKRRSVAPGRGGVAGRL